MLWFTSVRCQAPDSSQLRLVQLSLRAETGAPLETVVSGVVPDSLLAPPRRPSSNSSRSSRMLHIWPAAVALALSSFTSVLLFPFFTYVPMTRVFGIMQPSVRAPLASCGSVC